MPGRTPANLTGDLVAARGPLLRYVTSLLAADSHVAEDIVQEALLRAWLHADQLDWQARPIRQWLFRVARNLVVDLRRRDRSIPVGIAPEAFRAADGDPAEAVADRHLLVGGLRRIGPAHREILAHIHLLDRAGDDVAATLGIPRGTVRSRTHNALAALRHAIDLGDTGYRLRRPADPAHCRPRLRSDQR
ncbi:RNA polymerase sigma factor [Longispora fulva]|uniref:RNA polymerase sigma-70 factor (ECF subfamily) n=1 Tax=Longispora fulva TaxID=619741 RepID=A0A8J7GH11_9ACTN|nr:sigma-70 family RNA polymerase sigma factor [Longispora fulva]MBG6136552.1 RNA polymerase sigma-70 factor (ECF subfamily) [Longispora fulva]GIG59722.1 RNA polymerase sigma factor [Longispora fulva]